MHLAVEADVGDDLAAVGLERAAVVAEPDLGDPADEPVGELRRQPLGEIPVLALLPPAADDVVSFADLGHEERGVGRVVLEVGVEGDDDLAVRVVESGRQGGRLPEVLPEADDLDPRILGLHLLEGGKGPVGAAVVDQDDLERLAQLLPGRDELAAELGKAALLVIDREDERDGDFRGSRHRGHYNTNGKRASTRGRRLGCLEGGRGTPAKSRGFTLAF